MWKYELLKCNHCSVEVQFALQYAKILLIDKLQFDALFSSLCFTHVIVLRNIYSLFSDLLPIESFRNSPMLMTEKRLHSIS